MKAALNELKPDTLNPETVGRLIQLSDGSPGKAVQSADESMEAVFELIREIWECCIHNDTAQRISLVEEYGYMGDIGAYEQLYACFLYFLRGLYLRKATGEKNYISIYPACESIESSTVDSDTVEQIITLCETAIRGVRARGNTSLILFNFISNSTEILHGKKQQAG
jgi:hypothetical protein